MLFFCLLIPNYDSHKENKFTNDSDPIEKNWGHHWIQRKKCKNHLLYIWKFSKSSKLLTIEEFKTNYLLWDFELGQPMISHYFLFLWSFYVLVFQLGAIFLPFLMVLFWGINVFLASKQLPPPLKKTVKDPFLMSCRAYLLPYFCARKVASDVIFFSLNHAAKFSLGYNFSNFDIFDLISF